MKKSSCTNFNGIAKAQEGLTIYVARLRCKKWSCDYCAAINRLMWQAHILNELNKRPSVKWSFMTLTAHKNAHKSGKTLLNIQQGWSLLHKRLTRKFGRFEYVRVYEQHKSGAFHAHLLVGIANVEKTALRWLKDNAVACGMGYQVDWRDVHIQNAGMVVAYVMKYMTKNIQGVIELPKGIRRIQTSAGMGVPKHPESDKAWEFAPKGVSWQERATVLDLYDVSTGEHIGIDWFKDSAYYPPMLRVRDIDNLGGDSGDS